VKLLFNGQDAQLIDPNSIRSNIAWSRQSPSVLKGTLRDILVGSRLDISEERLLQALDTVGLASFVQQHPNGLNMEIGEGGVGLSGGQLQAVALARALVKGAAITILDEPTSAFDNLSEAHFKKSMPRHLNDGTLILISHKPSMLALADRLIVIEQGQIIADGPREQIIEDLKKGNIKMGASK